MSTVLSLWRGVIEVPEECVTMAEMIADIARRHRVTVGELRGYGRTSGLVWPRHEFMAAAYSSKRFSSNQIGRFLGGRDHSTILSGIKSHAARLGLYGLT